MDNANTDKFSINYRYGESNRFSPFRLAITSYLGVTLIMSITVWVSTVIFASGKMGWNFWKFFFLQSLRNGSNIDNNRAGFLYYKSF